MEDEAKKKVFKVATSTWQSIIKESRSKKKEGSVPIETKKEEEQPSSGFFLDFGDSSAPPMQSVSKSPNTLKSSNNKSENNTSRPRKSDE